MEATIGQRRRIWKYNLDVTDRQIIRMPSGAQILDVQMQGDRPCLWALVFSDLDLEDRDIAIYGTGNPMPDIERGAYIGTFQLHGGALVFHAFEILDGARPSGRR